MKYRMHLVRLLSKCIERITESGFIDGTVDWQAGTN
jgi:hypothetical protein